MVYLFKEEKMKKTIITLCAFVMLFGFAVTGAMALETWSWSIPKQISNGPFKDLEAFPRDSLYGLNNSDVWLVVTAITETPASVGIDLNPFAEATAADSVSAPPGGIKYAIDSDTVGKWDGALYSHISAQPNIPNGKTGEYKYIAAGTDGTITTLYVLFEAETNPVEQYLLVGTSDMEWEVATVRFTPRSLNLGSNGNWVTCKISGLASHTWDEVNLANLCIVGINDTFITTPICVDTDGPSNTKNEKKMMVKFDRRALANEISAWITNNPDSDPTRTKITLAYSDGDALNFYGEDTIKTKPAKTPKHKKK
jgi:hypothetical protein